MTSSLRIIGNMYHSVSDMCRVSKLRILSNFKLLTCVLYFSVFPIYKLHLFIYQIPNAAYTFVMCKYRLHSLTCLIFVSKSTKIALSLKFNLSSRSNVTKIQSLLGASQHILLPGYVNFWSVFSQLFYGHTHTHTRTDKTEKVLYFPASPAHRTVSKFMKVLSE